MKPDLLKLALDALRGAKYAIKGREHTGFIEYAIAALEAAKAAQPVVPQGWKFERSEHETSSNPSVVIVDPDGDEHRATFADGGNETENLLFRIVDAMLAAAPAPLVEPWVPVKERLPDCDMTPNSFGVQVLIYPPFKSEGASEMNVAFYGCRQTDKPNFYIFGRIFDPTHWMPLPAPPQWAKK